VAADMNNYSPVISSAQVAGQFPYEAYLYVYTSCLSAKALAEVSACQPVSAAGDHAAVHVSGQRSWTHGWHQLQGHQDLNN